MTRNRTMTVADLLPNERRALEAELAHEEKCADDAKAWARDERNRGHSRTADSLDTAALEHLRKVRQIAEKLA